MLARLVELAEKEIGPPPLPAALFVCGDGGRRELTLRRTLTLGVVFADTDDEEELAGTREYFEDFRALVAGTMPLCRPDAGASCLEGQNVRSFTGWARLFDSWATTGTLPPGAAGFFDMRPVTGRGDYVLHLRHHLFELCGRERNFAAALLSSGIGRRPPLGFVHHQVVEQSGEHRSELDLYEKGLRPLVEAVRLLAVTGGIENYSTRRRAAELARGGFEYAEEIEQALEYLLTLLIHHQLDQVEEGGAPDNFIDPESLSSLEKKSLKETFQLTGKLYDYLEEQARSGAAER
jgi:CBS domain-containing protein